MNTNYARASQPVRRVALLATYLTASVGLLSLCACSNAQSNVTKPHHARFTPPGLDSSLTPKGALVPEWLINGAGTAPFVTIRVEPPGWRPTSGRSWESHKWVLQAWVSGQKRPFPSSPPQTVPQVQVPVPVKPGSWLVVTSDLDLSAGRFWLIPEGRELRNSIQENRSPGKEGNSGAKKSEPRLHRAVVRLPQDLHSGRHAIELKHSTRDFAVLRILFKCSR